MLPSTEAPTKSQSNRSNFTFGPQNKNYASSPPRDHSDFHQNTRDNHQSQNNNRLAQFEISYPTRKPGPNLTNQLDELDHGLFFCYKVFVGIMTAVEGIGAIINLVGLFVPMSQNELLHYMGVTILLVWNTYQLALEFRAINFKNYELARRAVTLMKWYMVILAVLFAIGAGSFLFLDTPMIKDMPTEMYVLTIVLSIAMGEGIFYFLFLYGALKVRDLLAEVNMTLTETNYAQIPEY